MNTAATHISSSQIDAAIQATRDQEAEVILDFQRGNLTLDEANELLRAIKEIRLNIGC